MGKTGGQENRRGQNQFHLAIGLNQIKETLQAEDRPGRPGNAVPGKNQAQITGEIHFIYKHRPDEPEGTAHSEHRETDY